MPIDEVLLRARVERAFSTDELKLLCANVQQRVLNSGRDLAVDLDTVGGDTKAVLVLNLVEYLKRHGFVRFLLEAIDQERPGLLEGVAVSQPGGVAETGPTIAAPPASAPTTQAPPPAPVETGPGVSARPVGAVQGFVTADGLCA